MTGLRAPAFLLSGRTTRRLALLALFAILVNALAPTFAYAIAASQGGPVVEMCTSFGLQKVALPDGDGQAPAAASDRHCPFCLSAGPALPGLEPGRQAVLPPVLPGLPAGAETRRHIPDPFLSWHSLRRHGPPALPATPFAPATGA